MEQRNHAQARRKGKRQQTKRTVSLWVVLYSTASDPQPQMIPRPQMIPKMDRKWSSTASDPKVDRKWSREKLREWIGSYGTDYKKVLIIKRNLFLLPSREKGVEDARSQVKLYKAKKKWHKSENDMVSRMFHRCKKILNFVLNYFFTDLFGSCWINFQIFNYDYSLKC